jgi:hypothetical protein
MIDKGMLYRQNFSVGGRDGPASGDAPGPGDTGGAGGYGKDTNQFGDIGSSPTSTGGITDADRNRVKQQILNQKVIGTNKLNPGFFDRVAGIPSAFRTLSLKNLYDQKMGLKNISPSIFGTIANITNPQLSVYGKTDPELDMYGMTGEDLTDIDRLADAINTSELYGGITQSDFEKAFYGPEGKPDLTGGGDGGGITTLPYVLPIAPQPVEETPVEESSFYQMLRRNLGLI